MILMAHTSVRRRISESLNVFYNPRSCCILIFKRIKKDLNVLVAHKRLSLCVKNIIKAKKQQAELFTVWGMPLKLFKI